MLACAVLEGHERRASDRVADEDGSEDQAAVHDDAVCCNAIRTDVAHQLQVVCDGNNRQCDIRHHFRRAVDTGPADGFQVERGLSQAEEAFVGEREVDQASASSHVFGGDGGERCADHSHMERPDKDEVEGDIGYTGRDCDLQAEVRFSCCGAECLECELHHEEGQAQHADAPIGHAELEHLAGSAHGAGDDGYEQEAHDRHGDAAEQVEIDEQRELPVREFAIPFAAGLRDDRVAAGANHQSDRGQDHDDGHDEVHCREGGLSREIRYEQTVHDAVDACQEKRPDGGCDVFQQCSESEVL